MAADGPAGGIFADDVFTRHHGQATIFVPCGGPVRPMGRVTALVVPAVELAVITHAGPPADADRAYASLATYVTRHALAVDGPMREYYLVGHRDTPDHAQWRTEIGWPVFRAGTAATGGPALAALTYGHGGPVVRRTRPAVSCGDPMPARPCRQGAPLRGAGTAPSWPACRPLLPAPAGHAPRLVAEDPAGTPSPATSPGWLDESPGQRSK